MVNEHLLRLEFSFSEYETLVRASREAKQSIGFASSMPTYLVARCPICQMDNLEKINSYSLYQWNIHYGYARAVYSGHGGIVAHCPHFALVEPFFHFHGLWPAEAKGRLTCEVPHVIGHLLEEQGCLAVIHALPICRIEEEGFVPRYTVFMVAYFSEKPTEAYDALILYNVDYVEPGIAWPFIAPPPGQALWWELNHWVTAQQLYWIDASTAEMPLRTGDLTRFPYGNITGRRTPYIHTFPYPLAGRR